MPKNLKLFLDTANLEEIEKCLKQKFISGITTNPDIIAKEPVGQDPKSDYINHVQKIADLCKKRGCNEPSELCRNAAENVLSEEAKYLELCGQSCLKCGEARKPTPKKSTYVA